MKSPIIESMDEFKSSWLNDRYLSRFQQISTSLCPQYRITRKCNKPGNSAIDIQSSRSGDYDLTLLEGFDVRNNLTKALHPHQPHIFDSKFERKSGTIFFLRKSCTDRLCRSIYLSDANEHKDEQAH
ncbi:hypothetical protein LOAG_03695 [Loa loa]|uniref:Uncharacterized protein n=1 Tax=Loa loa TaxID=7209 RepID=A0A1S0U4B9_LOALO|nr:hypothetical protein LOAG_03695 [Loa loa]EFO24795.1 hypothetical protein LOAG_03695 [Loa loa]